MFLRNVGMYVFMYDCIIYTYNDYDNGGNKEPCRYFRFEVRIVTDIM